MKKPAAAAGLAAYYSRFGQAAACLALHTRYEDCGIAATRTRAFAEAVGARVELKIEKATCRENPQWDYLRSVGGDHNTSPSDRDGVMACDLPLACAVRVDLAGSPARLVPVSVNR